MCLGRLGQSIVQTCCNWWRLSLPGRIQNCISSNIYCFHRAGRKVSMITKHKLFWAKRWLCRYQRDREKPQEAVNNMRKLLQELKHLTLKQKVAHELGLSDIQCKYDAGYLNDIQQLWLLLCCNNFLQDFQTIRVKFLAGIGCIHSLDRTDYKGNFHWPKWLF